MNPHQATEKIEAILEQLLLFTKQLASYGKNGGVDVGALAGACSNRQKELEILIANLPGRAGKGPGRLGAIDPAAAARIKASMAKLREQSGRCVEVLSRAREDVGAELACLSKNRRALRAYRGMDGARGRA